MITTRIPSGSFFGVLLKDAHFEGFASLGIDGAARSPAPGHQCEEHRRPDAVARDHGGFCTRLWQSQLWSRSPTSGLL